MNGNLIKKSCAVLLSSAFLVSVVTFFNEGTKQNNALTATTSNVSKAKINRVGINRVTKSYQIDSSFPVKEIDNTDFDSWSLLNNVTKKFYGFKGNGSIWIKSNSPKSFNLYVNGKEVKVSDLASNKWVQIQIGNYTKDGNNVLQLSRNANFSSSDSMHIKLPYPELVDKTSDYKNNDSFQVMDKLITSEIKAGYPSAQIVVVHNGQIIKRSAYGTVNSYSKDGKRVTNSAKVNNDTLYDLASNTKMWATNMAIQKLVSEKRLDINEKVNAIFPEFQDGANDKIKGKSNLTIREILMHQAGFPADPQYHNNNYNPANPEKPGKNSNPVYTQSRKEILKKIIATPLDYAPGTKTVYSDVDYMLLGLIIEKITGQREDSYVENNIYKPLGLKHLLYNPLDKGFKKSQIAATELNGNTRDGIVKFNNIRTNTLQGQVHDEKAYYTMKGVSGHAGLFGNAGDLAVLAQTVINRGGYGNHRIFDEDTLDEFIKPKSTDATFGLGWRRSAVANGGYSWAFSNYSDASTVGHTGWTGTLTVVNPQDNTAVIVLTNERNTPIKKPETLATANDFAGGHFLLSKYGDIVNFAYAAINNDSAGANYNRLISLVRQRYNEIQKNKIDDGAADKADLIALYDTMTSYKSKDSEITKFLESKTGKKISSYVNKSRNSVNDLTK